METESIKQQKGKRRWDVFPWQECEEVVKVFEYGTQKYGEPFKYRTPEAKAGISIAEWLAAIQRHIFELYKGNSIDNESGCHHLAHIAANALMAIAGIEKETE